MAKESKKILTSRNSMKHISWGLDKGTLKQVSEILRYGLKEKVKSGTFEYLATEYGSLKSLLWFFMIEI